MTTPKGRPREFPEELISFLSLEVYRERLRDPDRQVREDGDGGAKQARRSRSYDDLTRAYLRVITRNRPKIFGMLA